MNPARPVLVAFDGSEGAVRAVEVAAGLLPGREAVVLSVWEPLLVGLMHHPFASLAPVPLSALDEDGRSADRAQRVAEHGAELARDAGLQARSVARADEEDVARAIVDLARDLDAEVIVTGSRGLSGFGAHRGSVSEHVLEHAGRPVLVVPEARA